MPVELLRKRGYAIPSFRSDAGCIIDNRRSSQSVGHVRNLHPCNNKTRQTSCICTRANLIARKESVVDSGCNNYDRPDLVRYVMERYDCTEGFQPAYHTPIFFFGLPNACPPARSGDDILRRVQPKPAEELLHFPSSILVSYRPYVDVSMGLRILFVESR